MLISSTVDSYSVVASVPKGYYALTTSGKQAMEAAIKAGVWQLTTLDGCVIPAGTKPPRLKPTCSSPPSTTVIAVNYSRTLGVKGYGSGTEYDKPGTTDGVIKEGVLMWTIDDLPAPGSYTTVLSYQSTTNAPTANFQVNNGSTQPVSLAATEGGLSSVTATLSGFVKGTNTLKMTPSGYMTTASVQLTKVGSATITTPGSGTTTNPGSGTTTNPGSGTASDALFSFAVPTVQAPWSYTSTETRGFQNIPIGAVSVLENDYLRVEIRTGFGGMVQVKDKTTGRWLINGPDQGRGDGASSYTQQHWTDNADYVDKDNNHPFSSNGPAPAPGPWFTGYNPLHNGDWVGHPATVLFHGKITIDGLEYDYLKTQLNSWSHSTNLMMPMYYECWVALDGAKIRQHIRLTHNRTDDLTDYGPYMQEWRMMMVNGNKKAVYYNGQSPFTNASVTYSDGIERIEPDGTYIKPGRAFGVSEPWIGVTINGDDTRMIAHYAPDLYFPSYNHMDPQEGSDCDGCKEGIYTSGHVMANLDAKGIWLFHDTWIVGSLADVRSYVYAQPRVGAPNWVFNSTTQRNFWHGNNGVNDGQLPNAATDASGWVMDWNGKADGGPANIDNTYISSPRTSFKGSDCPTLYVKAKLSNTSQTAWKVKYTYVGQERESLDSNYPNENAKRFPYSPQLASSNTPVNFTMTADGSVHIYSISMNWNSSSYINTVEIWPNGSNLQTQPHFEVLSIGCTNPD